MKIWGNALRGDTAELVEFLKKNLTYNLGNNELIIQKIAEKGNKVIVGFTFCNMTFALSYDGAEYKLGKIDAQGAAIIVATPYISLIREGMIFALRNAA